MQLHDAGQALATFYSYKYKYLHWHDCFSYIVHMPSVSIMLNHQTAANLPTMLCASSVSEENNGPIFDKKKTN